MSSEAKLQAWMESLADEGFNSDDLGDLEAALIGMIGRMRSNRDRAIRDMEAAKLLPDGWRAVSERFGVRKSTVYKMVHRAQSTARRTA